MMRTSTANTYTAEVMYYGTPSEKKEKILARIINKQKPPQHDADLQIEKDVLLGRFVCFCFTS